MDYDYGCQILNRYNFFLDKEDEDPSEILANASLAESKATAKDAKSASGKDGKTNKPGSAKSAPATAASAKPSKDGKEKKQPLQQKDNSAPQASVKSDEKKGDSGDKQGRSSEGWVNKQKEKKIIFIFFLNYRRPNVRSANKFRQPGKEQIAPNESNQNSGQG